MPYIFWTRSLQDWERDQTFFAHAKERVLSLPCVSFRAILDDKSVLEKVPSSLIITSRRVLSFLSSPSLQLAISGQLAALLKSCQSHCFGESTFAAIKAAGGRPKLYKAKTAKELAETIEGEGPFLYLGPKRPAYDMKGHLIRRGFACESLAIYETREEAALPPDEIKPMGRRLEGRVCFGSPSAVRGFLKSFDGDRLTAYCLGETTKAACGGYFKRVVVVETAHLGELAARALED